MKSLAVIILLIASFPSFSQKVDSTFSNYRWGFNVGSGVNYQRIKIEEINYPSQNRFYSFGFSVTRFITKKWELSAEMMNNFGTIYNEFQVNKNAHKYESDFIGFNIPLNVRYNINKIENLYFLPHFVQVGPSVNMLAHSIEKYEVNKAAVALEKEPVLKPEYRIKIGTGYVIPVSNIQFRTEFNYYFPLKSANSIEDITSVNNPAFSFNLIIENRFTKAQLKERKRKQWAKLNLINTLKKKRILK